MKIDDALIDHLATLSRLEVEGQERAHLKKDLQGILDMVEKLQELNTDGVEPLVYLSDRVNPVREDKVEPPLAKEKALQNAPSADSDYFKVPKIIDGE